jgi:hypothetical protein
MKTLNSIRFGFYLTLTVVARGGARATEPDFGPRVLIFEPDRADTQQRIQAVFKEQERAQFGSGRYALLFKPGRYELDVPVGFYTHVAGLGNLPGDVTIAGHVWTDAAWMNYNATCNFWRAMENLTVQPPDGVNIWAVSQAAPMRRTLIRGDLQLWSGKGGASGGFMADSRIDGVVKSGSQQQWFSRNSGWKEWTDVNWNMVFVGCENPPPGEWPQRAVTRIESTPLIREKPFLKIEGEKWFVQVPPLQRKSTSGLSWEQPALDPRRSGVSAERRHSRISKDSGALSSRRYDSGVQIAKPVSANSQPAGSAIPLDRFYLLKAGRDTAASINAALRAGQHLLVTPGIYPLEDTLVVSQTNTVILGLGFPSFVPTKGQTALRVDAGEGVIVSGLVFDAGPTETETLVQIGRPGRTAGRADNPTCIHDLVCRVGGYGPGKARLMVAIHDHHVIGDNFWLWRADHGDNVGWTENTCDTGLLVTGDDVTLYGLFVEHTQKHQTIWQGERGRVFFYQSEMPYDPPSQDAWRSPTGDGYASYRIANNVKTHEAWALGVYHVFFKAPVVAANAIESPESPGIKLHHLLTFRLDGGKPGSGIRNVVNNRGGEAIQARKAVVK